MNPAWGHRITASCGYQGTFFYCDTSPNGYTVERVTDLSYLGGGWARKWRALPHDGKSRLHEHLWALYRGIEL